MVRKEWQKEEYLKAHNSIKDALINSINGLTKTELYKKTRLARTTINRHLKDLMSVPQQVKKIGNHYWWGDKYNVVVREIKENAGLIEELDVLVGRQKELIAKLSRPENVYRWRYEAEPPAWRLGMPKRIPLNTDRDAPATMTFLTEEENLEFFKQREKVFGGLRSAFFDLAKAVMAVDVGFIDAEEDLSNVTVEFHNGRAVWSVHTTHKPQTHIYPTNIRSLKKRGVRFRDSS